MAKKTVGLLVMAYGTPYKEDDIERYYTHIRHGRKPPQEQIDDLKARYRAIGGLSPLAKITEAQAKQLEKRLNEMQDEVEFCMYLGLKHIEPFIEDAVERMHADGVKEAVAIVLAPHYSTFSIRSYNERAKAAAEKLGGPVIYTIDQWYDEPKFLQYWSEKVKAIFDAMKEREREQAVLIVSAHSLPEKIIQAGDPYPAQLEDTAKRIAEQAGVTHYAVGWQSAGNTSEPWLGPDVQDLTRQLHDEQGYTSFVYAPVGFVADHLEVLYDNDIECKQVTEEIGARYYRPEMPNTDPLFIDALATVVLKRLAKEGDEHE
ncbi:ferrochelatase [Geobacillus thermodenitrificans]|uniref:ferrochelatase n=1 Tax=Geobacillus thermodenitrificans TaxID=33940 RepID=UPI002E090D4B|nr:ferrochelatase [Geobacillus thermodenitrificans]MEC5188863.1 ferrochelatase [Geobacillus thermodenitrificans]